MTGCLAEGAVDAYMAAGLLGEAVDHRQAEAVPWPIGLVVKNGSNALAMVCADMPAPLSVTQSTT